MKKTKIIVPALGMLLLSTAASVTGTVAWFAMNTEVSASNMQVRAVAEKGILINEVKDADDENWDNVATTTQAASSATKLYPTSTSDGQQWYHAASKLENSAAGAAASSINTNLVSGGYKELSLTSLTGSGIGASATAGSNAERNVYGEKAADEIGYYVTYTYYIKSSSAKIEDLGTETGKQNLNIKSVTATPTADSSNSGDYTNSADLDKALRVGIQFEGKTDFYIYAPISGATLTYYVNASATATVAKEGTVATDTSLASIPASDTDGQKVNIFIWFEGEDANCKSTNAKAAILDSIKIDVVFALVTK